MLQYGSVAQLVECLPEEQEVDGSEPSGATNSPRKALSYDEAADRVKTAMIWETGVTVA